MLLTWWLGISWGEEKTSDYMLQDNSVGANYAGTNMAMPVHNLMNVDWLMRNEGII